MKRPAFQFYPADWRKDLELQSCSIAARGLWHEMMCVMHEAEPYGHLVLNGKPMTDLQAATACRVTPQQYRALVAELKTAGVPGVTDDGILFSRRMVRDEETRNARAEGGKGGAEHGIKGKEHGSKGGRPKKETGDKKPPLKPPPSSSSSSSPSGKSRAGARTPLPENWNPSEATVARLAAEFKFTNGDAERYASAFRDICASKGYAYVDFDAAFSNCVRQDWPKFRAGAPTMPKHIDPNRPHW